MAYKRKLQIIITGPRRSHQNTKPMKRNESVKLIAGRIRDEFHRLRLEADDWTEVAAKKIHDQFLEYWIKDFAGKMQDKFSEGIRIDIAEEFTEAYIKERTAGQSNKQKDFHEWYVEFRQEMASAYNVNYAISIASWTFSDKYDHYYKSGLTPKQAVIQYSKDKKQ